MKVLEAAPLLGGGARSGQLTERGFVHDICSAVHVLGVAYKRDIDDVRESPALDIIHLLGKRGAKVSYSDPFVPKLRADGVVPNMTAIDPVKAAATADCVVVVTDHKGFDYPAIVKSAKLIVDTRNALKGNKSSKIVRL